MTFTVRPLLAAAACAAGLLSAGLAPAPAHAAELPSPQATAANAEFLATAPPPPVSGRVCVVDTGVDLTTDAAPAVVERWATDGGSPDDLGSRLAAKHGTYVAGVIASQPDGAGSVGIWPQAQIISVRVFAGAGTTAGAYLKALDICAERRATVANLSLGGLAAATREQLDELENRIERVRRASAMTVVAAAGNDGGDVVFPARFAAVVAVGGTDAGGGFCWFSGRGRALDLSAPGCGVMLSLPSGNIAVGDGTSFATPAVSAVLAALRAYRPDLGAQAAEDLLLATARQAQSGLVLDAAAAFRAAGLGALAVTPEAIDGAVPTGTHRPSPSGASPSTPSSDPSSPEAPPLVSPWSQDPLRELGIERPRLLHASYRGRVLRVRVAGIPEFARALFIVDGHRHTRARGALRLSLRRRPHRVLAMVDVPQVGRSPALRVRVLHRAGASGPTRRPHVRARRG